jgi:hypothetical protein
MSRPADRGGSDSNADVANEDEVASEFPHGDGRPLREQTPLVDEDGDDIRQYTGEPVETDEGWVLPQQTATGTQNVVGGGEFPNTPGRADDDDTEDATDRN